MATHSFHGLGQDVDRHTVAMGRGTFHKVAACVDEAAQHVERFGAVSVTPPGERTDANGRQVEPGAAALLQVHASSLAESATATVHVARGAGEWFRRTPGTTNARRTSCTGDSFAV